MDDDISVILNIIIIGDPYVGKTNLLTWYMTNEFNDNSLPTIGADFSTKIVEFNGYKLSIKFWDTAG